MRYQLLSLMLIFTVLSCGKTTDTWINKDVPVAKTFRGKARIVLITPAKDDTGRESQEFMDIYFDFISAEKSGYMYPDSKDTRIILNYDDRNVFHKNWIEKWGIKEGNEYPAVRREVKGKTTGAHVYYEVELSPGK